MKETRLWDNLRPELDRLGSRMKFQKVSDRFTPGVPDIIGTYWKPGEDSGTPYAFELKELYGVRTVRADFRPGQLDWLRDWEAAGGRSWIVSTAGQYVYVHPWRRGVELETGMDPQQIVGTSLLCKEPRASWRDFVAGLLAL